MRDPELELSSLISMSRASWVRERHGFAHYPGAWSGHIVAFAASKDKRRDPLIVDATTARILMLSDGTRTAGELVEELTHTTEVSDGAAPVERLENPLSGLDPPA
jgi:hypothetical protein